MKKHLILLVVSVAVLSSISVFMMSKTPQRPASLLSPKPIAISADFALFVLTNSGPRAVDYFAMHLIANTNAVLQYGILNPNAAVTIRRTFARYPVSSED